MTATLYETDYYAWTQEQASLIRNEEIEKLDLTNLFYKALEIRSWLVLAT